jgi:hypothetical protein
VVDEPSIGVAAGVIHVVWEQRFNAQSSGPSSTTSVIQESFNASGQGASASTLDVLAHDEFNAEEATPEVLVGGGRVTAVWVRAEEGQIALEDLKRAGTPVTVDGNGFFPGDVHAGFARAGALVLAWDALFETGEDVDGVVVDVVAPGGTRAPSRRLTARRSWHPALRLPDRSI